MEIKERKRVACPHCGQSVLIGYKLEIEGLEGVPDKPAKSKTDAYLEKCTPQQLLIIQQAKAAGLYDAFVRAAEQASTTRTSNYEKLFITFFQTCRGRVIQQFIMDYFKALYPNTIIACVGTNGIAAITSNNRIVEFVPYVTLFGGKLRKPDGNYVNLGKPTQQGLDEWVKTRYGYVPANGLFYDELRKRSIGEFANIKM